MGAKASISSSTLNFSITINKEDSAVKTKSKNTAQ